jgi:hypothetical protein
VQLLGSRRQGARVNSTVSICKLSLASLPARSGRCLAFLLQRVRRLPSLPSMGKQRCRRRESTYPIVSPQQKQDKPVSLLKKGKINRKVGR